MSIAKVTLRVFIIGMCLFFPNISAADNNECVILLHGLARTHHSMSKLELTLKQHHYVVVNHNYPSTKKSINELADKYIPPLLNECFKHHPKRVHFVTHSLGGIILQHYLRKNTISKLEHIVMLGPPNHGSPLTNLLHKNWVFQLFLGPSFVELTTKHKDIHLMHGRYKIGIIAGNYNLNPFGKIIFDEPNDGKVAVSSAKMKQMNDFIILPVTHTFMMKNALVEKQILHFLAHGNFIH